MSKPNASESISVLIVPSASTEIVLTVPVVPLLRYEIANVVENDAPWGEDPERDAEMLDKVERARRILERDLARGGRDTAAWLNAATFRAALEGYEEGWEQAEPRYQALLDQMTS